MVYEVQYETTSYQSDPLVCPKCGSQMRILSFITQPRVINKILETLEKPRHPDTRSSHP